ncbi:hypothetical protein P3342_013135 [Pyrenophora teres f. teres]|nr:hypothetical protein PTNB85_06566 [Pyrenophora teres f. teres]KAE8837221.1 hypothetical protein HRS9122_07376 [Pyrenophora teres f. teres]KAE8855835.1 hypothetical protein PTNB29_08674 [Pyrenophora teres f. teres]KAK1911829.1 hypothetical protein P3342_013135 [Pyrenophora teres f. teres]
MVDKMTRRSAGKIESSTERGRPRRRISERPVAPQPLSPYGNDNEPPNPIDGNPAPRREPRSLLERLEEAMQERPQPQDSIGTLDEVADEIFEDADTCSISSSRPSSPTEEGWENVQSHMLASQRRGDSYLFPGTWPAALADTSQALRGINAATSSYFAALSQSGIGRATSSISTAALSSTNSAALALTAWGLAKTGFGIHELPRPLKKWVMAKEARETRRMQKEARRRRREVGSGVFEDGGGNFVLGTREMVGEGGGDGWEVQELREREEVVDGSEGEDVGVMALRQLDIDDDEDEGDGMLMGLNFEDDEHED